MHHLVNKAGYQDINIDFSSVTSITRSVLPPLASYLRYMRQEYKIDFNYYKPKNPHVANFIRKHGLDYQVSPYGQVKIDRKSSEPIILQFRDHDEREAAVDRVINSALRITSLSRQHIAGLDWAVNEITDNVLTHSGSKVGGFLICHTIQNRGMIEFVVADSGIGIAQSLGVDDEVQAVELAIQEGVTRNKSSNQGNGLFGTYKIGLASSGIFVLKSRHGNLFVSKNGEVHVRKDAIPFRGTFLVCQIDYNQPDLIERALVFNGRSHDPAFDYLERKHEVGGDDEVVVSAEEICKTFGSRQSGLEARKYLVNILNVYSDKTIVIDFTNISVISSSFADEVFGKIFVEMGPMRFMRMIKLRNTVSAVEALIDRAITLRSRTGM